jgi:hypothetical protein
VFSPAQERVPAFSYQLAGMTLRSIGDVVYLFADIDFTAPKRLAREVLILRRAPPFGPGSAPTTR